MKRFDRSLIVFLVILSIFGWSSEARSVDNSVRSIKTVVARKGVKRVVKVFLNNKVTKEQLRFYATQIKNGDSNFYERTFIDYFLPRFGSSSSWATTHFNPGLEVKIVGLTMEQESKLIKDKTQPSGEIIGAWLLEDAYISRKLTIYKHGGEFKVQKKYPDLSHNNADLAMTTTSQGKIFSLSGDPDSSTNYIVNKAGDIEIWDRSGLVATAYKLR